MRGQRWREAWMRRELGQLSLADGLVDSGAGRNRQLEKITALVDWAAFERLLRAVYAAPVGQPSYGPVVLMKCLLLQQWYRLSDPGLEEALFGYKMHLAIDQGSGLVRQAILTPGHVSDKAPFLDLVQGDEQTVGACPRAGLRPDPGADCGYDGWWYRQELAARHRRWHHGGGLPAAAAGCRRARAQSGARGAAPADRAHVWGAEALVRLRPRALPVAGQKHAAAAVARRRP